MALLKTTQDLYQHNQHLEAKLDIVMEEQKKTRQAMENHFRLLRRQPAIAISRVSTTQQSPARTSTATQNVVPRAPTLQQGAATMCSVPGNLYILWQEWQHGIGGRKAVRLFTAKERGLRCNKYKFYQRKHVWNLIKKHLNAGWDAHAAIERIYAVYGQEKPVTQIIRAIMEDRKRYANEGGINPALRTT